MTQLLLEATTAGKREKNRAFILQFGIVFLLLLTLPLSGYYYHAIATFHIGHIHFQDLFQLANYIPFLGHDPRGGFQSFEGWLWAVAAGLALTAIWTYYDKSFIAYEDLWYYGLRVLLRYRLAAALFSYGFLLLL